MALLAEEDRKSQSMLAEERRGGEGEGGTNFYNLWKQTDDKRFYFALQHPWPTTASGKENGYYYYHCYYQRISYLAMLFAI